MEAGDGSAVVAVDAPLVIRNRTGIRDSERAMNQEFRRFHAGAPRRQSRPPFCPKGSVVQSEALRPGLRPRRGDERPGEGSISNRSTSPRCDGQSFQFAQDCEVQARPARISCKRTAPLAQANALATSAASSRIVVAFVCHTPHWQAETRRRPDRCRAVLIYRRPLVVLGNPPKSRVWLW